MDDPVVDTCSGKIRGCIERSILGEDYFAFKGIPYAKPPIGEFRFQDPLPVSPWDYVKNCKEFGSKCAQSDLFTKVISGSDDCLYLNVYAKSLKTSSRLPVMVWIHGGGFENDSGNDDNYGPDYLISKNIVLVTINYRLGVLGFLNLDNEVASGNQGLKDQVMALKWVRDNIVNFNGDSNNVTIFGESAGGACVHYLTLSPLAKGLFHKAILQSGVILNPWASNPPNEAKEYAYRLCEILGKKTKDSRDVVNFLRTVDCLKLIEAQEKCLTPEEKIQLFIPFAPGVDAKSKNPFMPVDPAQVAKEGIQVPVLIGSTGREGILMHQILKDGLLSKSIKDFRKCLKPNISEILKMYGRSTDDLRHFYLNNEELNEHNHENMADLLGDMYFVEGIHRTIKIQVDKSSAPTYFYRFTYDKTPSILKNLIGTTLKGACHTDDLHHLFRAKKFEQANQPHLKKGTVPFRIMEQMVEQWVNFASTGRPTPTISNLVSFYWQPVTNGSVLRYLNLCEDMQMEVTLNMEQILTSKKVPKIEP